MNTGKRVDSLTNSATCGFQINAVAYQFPSAVVAVGNEAAVGCLIRASSFCVQ